MKPDRLILARDVLIGLGLVVTPGSLLADGGDPLLALPVVAVALSWAGVQYLFEHEVTPAWTVDLAANPFALAVLVFAVGMLVVLVAVLWPATVNWFAAGLLGLGVGLLGYRFVYGVLRPIPERPLERVSEGRA